MVASIYKDIALLLGNDASLSHVCLRIRPIAMTILSQRSFLSIRQTYREKYDLRIELLSAAGYTQSCRQPHCPCHLAVLQRARADGIQQAVRWGEPYMFFLAPGVLTWIVPLVDGARILGGLTGGEVRTDDDGTDRLTAINYLTEAGCPRKNAAAYVKQLPVWAQSQTPEAAQFLFECTYAITSLTPTRLTRNRENSLQQRQIAESIQERKQSADRRYPIREEQMLLSLMRVGDLNGARRVLNDMLAAMFLYSPNPVLIRARAIEMMGFLVRAAIEDSPVMEPLMERHQEWIGQIIGSESFERLCEVLRHMLDDFANFIFTQGYNRSSPSVQRILACIGANFMSNLTLDSIAADVGLSRYHVARVVKQRTGKTITQHIRTLRVKKASELLALTNKPYVEIAYDLGFADQSYFIKQFREMTGTTPARYRKARQAC